MKFKGLYVYEKRAVDAFFCCGTASFASFIFNSNEQNKWKILRYFTYL